MTQNPMTPASAAAMTSPQAGPAPQADAARPLEGVRIAITHAAEQAEEQSRRFGELGAQLFLYPAIELVPFDKSDELDAALRQAADGAFDWLVLNDADTVLVVADRSALASVARRRELTDYVIRRSDEIRRFQVAIAYVIPTPIVRGILFSLFAVVAQPTPYVVVATEEEARAWLQGRLHSSS